jgi:hypothetical protein
MSIIRRVNVELNNEQITQVLYELRRIGNAVEVLAMRADPEFVPLDDNLRTLRNSRLKKAQAPTKPQVPRSQAIP